MRTIEQQHDYGEDFVAERSSLGTEHQKRLAYSDEFREFVRDHRGIIGKTLDLIRKSETNLSKGPIKIGALSLQKLRHKSERPIFRLDLAPEEGPRRSLFIKKVERLDKHKQGGYDEILAYKEAQERLRGIDWVDLITYDMAWSYKNVGYVVSDFHSGAYPAHEVENYLTAFKRVIQEGGPQAEQAQRDLTQLEDRIETIQNLLPGFFDTSKYNMAYDPKTKKILLYDLNFDKDDNVY